MTHISGVVRQRVADEARHRCGYCQAQEVVMGMPFEIEHIIAEVAGGSSHAVRSRRVWIVWGWHPPSP